MTQREQILAAIKTKMESITGMSNKVFRSRKNPFDADKMLPCITIEPLPDSANVSTLQYTDWTLGVRISVWVKGDVPDTAADPIIEDVEEKMMEDLTLGGLVMDLEPKLVTPEFDEGSVTLGAFHFDFDLKYRTLR